MNRERESVCACVCVHGMMHVSPLFFSILFFVHEQWGATLAGYISLSLSLSVCPFHSHSSSFLFDGEPTNVICNCFGAVQYLFCALFCFFMFSFFLSLHVIFSYLSSHFFLKNVAPFGPLPLIETIVGFKLYIFFSVTRYIS